jgi:hypothetical protein
MTDTIDDMLDMGYVPAATDKQPDPIPTDMPEDTRYLGDRLDQIRAALGELVDATVRQETPAASIYFAMPAATGRNDFPQPNRVRLTNLVVSISAAAVVTVTIGTAAYLLFQLAAADTRVIPFPLTIAEGTDVVVTVSAGTLVAALFTGYVESDKRRNF